jgi:hypothetical protein
MHRVRNLLFKPLIWSTLVAAALTLGTFGSAALLTLAFGDRCWPPRIGGILVGLSVFLQGYCWAHPEDFQRVLRTGHTTEQLTTHSVYVATLFGTFVWALGDFLPPFLGVAMCRPPL